MSKWLKSVSNALDNLDGHVETVSDSVTTDVPTSRGAVQDILSRRGLNEGDDEEEGSYYDDDSYDDDGGYYTDGNEEEWEEDVEIDSADGENDEEETIDLQTTIQEQTSTSRSPLFESDTELLIPPQPPTSNTLPQLSIINSKDGPNAETDGSIEGDELVVPEEPEEQSNPLQETQNKTLESISFDNIEEKQLIVSELQENLSSSPPNPPSPSTSPSPTLLNPQLSHEAPPSSHVSSAAPPSPPASGQISISSSLPLDAAQLHQQLKKSNKELRKHQSETKKLRKHVVVLHDQLQAAESELKAQREELTRAADRMENDRGRYDEEKEDLMDEHEEELENQKDHYEQMLQEQKERFEQQVRELEERLHRTEEQRKQEGGDWTMELDDAITRERDMIKKLGSVQDENANLQSKVAKLEAQHNALQSRLDSATQNVQNSTERERQTGDKLDAALASHTRQLNQRKARESELERTVADLGAALVVARRKEKSTLIEPSSGSSPREDIKAIKQERDVALEELDTLKGQMNLEQERCEMLKQELSTMTKERTESESGAQVRQRMYDQKVADLTATISRLKSSLRETKRLGDSSGESQSMTAGQLTKEREELRTQVKSLSEQLIRQQNIVDNSKTEISTLKSRLQAAISRAENAEMESGPISGNMYEMDVGGNAFRNTRLRRRVKGGVRNRMNGTQVRSIRSALGMDPGRVAENLEPIAVTIDGIDSILVETGGMFKQEPLARLAFFLYLIVLHLWTFCLVIFHAHSYEIEHGDFGSLNQNAGLPTGPDSLVHNSLRSGHSP